jgi:uncharacterized cupin superfamily protein
MKLDLIHTDIRGSISTVTGLKKFPELVIVETKEGFARGGCVHTEDEFCTVVEGRIVLYFGTCCEVVIPGNTVKIKANTPHYFISITDSVVMEWGPSPKFNEKNIKMRAIVDKINREKSE